MQHEEYWPNLFIPGAGRSGTTSLHHYLNQHPDVWMSKDKEPVFFNNQERFNNVRSVKHYLSLFEKGKDKRYRGESSTAYMDSVQAIEQIKKKVKEPKFIFVLRNPIDRAYSHYTWLCGCGLEERDFEDAFYDTYRRFLKKTDDKPYYYSQGLYGRWLCQYLDHFGHKNMHIILSENLAANPLTTLNSCHSFLQLESIQQLSPLRLNKSVQIKNPLLYKKFVNSLANTSGSFLRKIYSYSTPTRLRIAIRRNMIHVLNRYKDKQATDLPLPVLNSDIRSSLKELYQEEVSLLEGVFKVNISAWSDFNNIE